MGAGVGTGGPLQFRHAVRESAQGGLMTLVDVARRLGVDRRTLFRIRNTDPTFPKGECFGARMIAFRGEQISEWCKKQNRVD
jgi:predicted DNA-binding transcriptional regulator AlpA